MQEIEPEELRKLAEARGLHRAQAQFPEAVQAAAEKGLRPPALPAGLTPVTEPAAVFRPRAAEAAGG